MNDWGKSDFKNIGIAYGFGPINFSITHLNSNNMGNKLSAISFGSDFKIGKGKLTGLVPYIEYTKFSMQGQGVYLQSTQTYYEPIKNTGYVMLFGMRFIF